MIELPTSLDYPIVAVADLHGRREELGRLIERLGSLPEWAECALMFLGDFVDRGPDVRGTVDLVLELLGRPRGGSAVMGNHDLALVRAARLDDGPDSPYWVDHYRIGYDNGETFRSYLGRPATRMGDDWPRELLALREAMPAEHRDFLASLPWVVEAPGHLFLHCGLSDELGATAEEQVRAMKSRSWDRERLRPEPGSKTDLLWKGEYPAWLGADRRLSESPRPYPGKVQVGGHVKVYAPEADDRRIRLDTSGGEKDGTLTACLLRSPGAAPVFIASR